MFLNSYNIFYFTVSHLKQFFLSSNVLMGTFFSIFSSNLLIFTLFFSVLFVFLFIFCFLFSKIFFVESEISFFFFFLLLHRGHDQRSKTHFNGPKGQLNFYAKRSVPLERNVLECSTPSLPPLCSVFCFLVIKKKLKESLTHLTFTKLLSFNCHETFFSFHLFIQNFFAFS